MTLLELREHLRRAGARLSLRGDELVLGAPAGSVSPEALAALKVYRDVFIAWGLRRRKDRWPSLRQERWGIVANALETDEGLRFPASEIEAFSRVRAEMENL